MIKSRHKKKGKCFSTRCGDARLQLLSFETGDFLVNAFVLLEHLLAFDQELDTVDDHLYELDLGESDAVSVADVEGSVV